MTVPSTTRRAGPFTGNGVTTSFPFSFKVFGAADIALTIANASGVAQSAVLNQDYLVTLNVDQTVSPGGSVQYAVAGVATALPTGYTLAITGSRALAQTVTLPTGGAYQASVVEAALDSLEMQIQQVDEATARSLTLSPLAPVSTDTTLPAPTANTLLGWNSDASALQNVDPATMATIVAYGTSRRDIFTGDGVTLAFTLSNNPGAQANLDVDISGVTQRGNGLDFTWTGGTTLTFTSPPPAGASIQVRYFQGLAQGTADAAAVVLADAGGYFPTDNAEAALQTLGHVISSAAGDGAGKVPFSASAIPAAINFTDWGIRTAALGANVLRYIPVGDWANVLAGVEGNNLATYLQTAINAESVVYIPGLIYCGTTTITLPAGKRLTGISGDRTGGVATSDANIRWRSPTGICMNVNRGCVIEGITFQAVGTPGAASRAVEALDCFEMRDVRIRDFPAGIRFFSNQFYTRLYSVEITNATTGAFWFSNQTVYNLQCFGCILRSSKPFLQDAGIAVQMNMIGCSIERMIGVWNVRQFSNVSFNNCYFELNAADWAAAGSPTAYDFINPEQNTTVSIRDSTAFLNYIRRFIGASGINNVTINLSGNHYRQDTTSDLAVTSCVVFPPNSGQVVCKGDSWVNVAGTNSKYFVTDASAVPFDVVEPTGYATRIGVGTLAADPLSLAAGATQQFTVTVSGAAVGQKAQAAFSLANAGIRWSAEVTAANTVTVTQENVSAGAIDLAAGTLTAWVTPSATRA